MEIKEILEKFQIDKTAFVRIENGVDIVILNHYLPFDYSDFDVCEIDAYYLASNKNYFLVKDIVSKLKENGFKAEIYKGNNYKQIAVKSGLVSKGLNTLTYDKDYGSYFCIGIISVSTDERDILTGLNKDTPAENICINCEICLNACPTKAISHQGFIKENCIRFQQENSAKKDEDILAKAQNQLLGCSICQSCCPLNKKIMLGEIDKDILLFLNKADIIDNIKDSKQLKMLSKYIGVNYARKNMLLPLANILLHK